MNMRRIGIGAVITAVFVAGLGAGIGSAGWLSTSAEPMGLSAALGAAREVPEPTGVGPNAKGTFVAALTRKSVGGTLAWRLTFKGLTGKAGSAHVHLGKLGKAGPVAVPLCGPCRSGMRGTANVNGRTLKALLAGTAYVNVHTAKNPAGEIRGQVKRTKKAPPIPGTTTGTTTTSDTTTTTDPYPYP